MINKFRVFDKISNNYHYNRFMLTEDGKLYDCDDSNFHDINDDYIIEFSTGLTDLNGTEIFEGDTFIGEDGFCENGYIVIEFDVTESKFIIKKSVFFRNEIITYSNFMNVRDLYDVEIAGNINTKPNKILKIIKCYDPLMWYYSKINDIIPYTDEDSDNYYCRDNEGYENFVKKSDAISIQY